jgi:hypothetical protein
LRCRGFSRSVFHILGDSHDILIDNCFGDSEYQSGEFAVGVALKDTAHNITHTNCTMMRCIDTNASYWNGDGFCNERGNYNITYEDCVSRGNADGGYDCKSTNTTFTTCIAVDNCRNWRLWGTATLNGCIGLDPHKRGGTSSQAQVWAKGTVTINGGYFADSGTDTKAFLSDSGNITFTGNPEVWHAGTLDSGSGISGSRTLHTVSATGKYSTNGASFLPAGYDTGIGYNAEGSGGGGTVGGGGGGTTGGGGLGGSATSDGSTGSGGGGTDNALARTPFHEYLQCYFGAAAPGGGGGGGGGGSPNYATNESLAEVTTTAQMQDGASLTETLTSGQKYMFLWSVDVGTSTTSSAASSDVTIDGTTIFATPPNTVVNNGSTSTPRDYHAHGGMFEYTGDGSSHTFTVRSGRGANPGTAYQRNSRLSYVILGADDAYAESLPRQTFPGSISGTAQTAASLAFTSPSASDYLVLVSAHADLTSSTNVALGIEVTDGTTTTGEIIFRPVGSGSRVPLLMLLPLSAVNGAKTISVKIRETGSGSTSIGISEIRILALRLARFAASHIGTLGADSSGTEGTYTTSESQTFTPAAADHLTLASWFVGSSSTGVSTYSQFLDGAVSVNENIKRMTSGSSTSYLPCVSHRLAAYPASSLTQAIQRRSAGTSNNAIRKSATIATISLAGI